MLQTQDLAAPRRVGRAFEVGESVSQGRKRLGLSQDEFATRLGVSRKTISELERGEAENISLTTALRALALAGLIVEVTPHRKPTINDVLARRAQDLSRVDESQAEGAKFSF